MGNVAVHVYKLLIFDFKIKKKRTQTSTFFFLSIRKTKINSKTPPEHVNANIFALTFFCFCVLDGIVTHVFSFTSMKKK
jgi:hypothetical protein